MRSSFSPQSRPAAALSTLLAVALVAGIAFAPAAAAQMTAGTETRISDFETDWQRRPAAVAQPGASFTVLWEVDHLGVRGRSLAVDGSQLGNTLAVLDNDTLPGPVGQGPVTHRRQVTAVPIPGGGYYLFWTEEQGYLRMHVFQYQLHVIDKAIRGQRFGASGQPQGLSFAVDREQDGWQSEAAAIALPGGGALVAWASDDRLPGVGPDDGIFVRTYGPLGVSTSRPRRIVNAEGAARPSVARLPGGEVLVAWEGCCGDGDKLGVSARLLTSSGEPVGPAFAVSAGLLGLHRRPAVAASADGDFLVAWQGQGEGRFDAHVFGQMVSADGAFLGAPQRLSEGIGNAQISPAAAALPGGGFALFWLDWQENFPLGLYGTTLDRFGNPEGGEMTVSEAQVNAQFRFGLATDAGGRMLLTWEGFDGEQRTIFARLVTADDGSAERSLSTRPMAFPR